MAIVVRYFSTSAAGAGDGTTWADRAAFYSGGAYSTIITGFDYNAGDSLEVRLGPGTYSAPTTFQTSIFTSNPPRPANPLTIHGCDSSGNRIVPAEWNCCQGALPITGYPVWSLAANNVSLPNLILRCLYITGTHSSLIYSAGAGSVAEYCRIEKTNNDTGQVASVGSTQLCHSCHFIATGTQYGGILNSASSISNCRVEGNALATSGNRFGISVNTAGMFRVFSRNCIINCQNSAIVNSASSTGSGIGCSEFTIVNCATVSGAAISGPNYPSTGTNLQYNLVYSQNNFIANCGVGVSTPNVSAKIFGNRLRNTTNYSVPTNSTIFGNYEAAGSDADEFVDAANGDYRIKKTSIYWGKGIGAGDEPASGASRPLSPFYQGVIG